MKIGIFSDIHGNIYAFEEVIKKLAKEKTDLNIFCGDICGYYYYNEVIEILKKINNLVCVSGNHDDIFVRNVKKGVRPKEYIARYGNAYDIFRKNIKPNNLDFLIKLPSKHFIEKYKIAIFHGSPFNHLNSYVYPDDPLEDFKGLKYRYIFLGHTHYPMDRIVGKTRIINPGSCGQPRDFNQSSFALLDIGRNRLSFKRVCYNSSALIKDILKHKEKNSYLIDVLKRPK